MDRRPGDGGRRDPAHNDRRRSCAAALVSRGGSSQTTDSAVLGVHGKLSKTTTAFVEYHRGLDRLDMFTVDGLAAGEANTLSLGGAVAFTPFVGVAGRYDFQARPESLHVHRANAVLTFRF